MLLTWATLLGRWMEFARASVVLPEHERRAVTPIIELQAITLALRELDDLPPGERTVGIERASFQIERAHRALLESWDPLPSNVRDLLDDAIASLDGARGFGVEWIAQDRLFMSGVDVATLIEAGFVGDLFLVSPGTLVFPGTPIAFAKHLDEGVEIEFEGTSRQRGRLRQVYRDASRDVIVPIESPPEAGMPLLECRIRRGVPLEGVPRKVSSWMKAQEEAFGGGERVVSILEPE